MTQPTDIDDIGARVRQIWFHRGFLQVPYTFFREFDLATNIYLCMLITWHDMLIRNGEIQPQDQFFLTQDTIMDRVFLSEDQQKLALQKLKSMGVVSVERRDMPSKNYYSIDYKRIEELILSTGSPMVGVEGYKWIKDTPNNPGNSPKTDQKAPSQSVANPPTSGGVSHPHVGGFPTRILIYNSKIEGGSSFGTTIPGDDVPRANAGLNRPNRPTLVNRVPTPVEDKPKTYQKEPMDIIAYWNNSPGLTHHKVPVGSKAPTKTFLTLYKTVKGVLDGTFFTSVGLTKHARPYLKLEVTVAIDRFKLMATNANFEPASKAGVANLGLEQFFYNPYSTYKQSWFLHCLENEPVPVTNRVKREAELNPQMTIWLRDTYVKQVMLGQERAFNRIEENKFIRGANLLHHTIRKLQPKLNLMTRPSDWCRIVVESLIDRWGMSEVQIGHISSEYTYTDILPKYMITRGRMG